MTEEKKEDSASRYEYIERQAEVHMGYKHKNYFKFYHLIVLAIVSIFFSCFLLDFPKGFASFIKLQIGFILSDWQLALALIMIIVLSIGWYLIEIVAIIIDIIDLYVTGFMTSKITNKIRLVLGGLFLSFFLSILIFKMDFSNIMLYFTTFLFFCLLTLIYRSIHKTFKKPNKSSLSKQKKRKSYFMKPVSDYYNFGWKFKVISIGIMFFSIFFIIFLIADAITNQWGVYSTLVMIWHLIITNWIMFSLFILIIIFTVLWRPIKWGILALTKFMSYLITDPARKKINRMRFLFIIFAFSLLFLKNINLIIEDQVIAQVLSFCLSIVITLLSTWLMRRFTSIS